MGLEPTTSSLGRRPVYGSATLNRTGLERTTSIIPRNRTYNSVWKTDLVDPQWTRRLKTVADAPPSFVFMIL
jgi:hypothetical protein